MSATNSAPTERRWLLAALVGAAAALPYLNSLAGGYAFDDLWMITYNPVVQQRDVAGALTEQTSHAATSYRPLVLLSYVLNEWLGFNPFGYHLVNVALHVCVSVGVLLLAAALLESPPAALLAGLLFAVHPIHTEVVANIVGRTELLAASLVLLSLGAYLRFLDGRRPRLAYALSLLAFGLGPFAKENALTALPMLAVLHHWRQPAASWRRRLAPLVPFALAAALYIGVRIAATGALTYTQGINALDNAIANVPWWIRIQTALPILWDYLALLVMPLVLSADYSYNQVPIVLSAADPRFVVALLLFAAGAAVLFHYRRRARPVVLGAVLGALAISMTANIAFPIGTIKAERLLYLPSVGWCLACGWLAAAALRARPRPAAAVVGAILALFAIRTWVRNYDWRDNTALYQATVQTAPNNAKVLCAWGIQLAESDRGDAAFPYFERALQILPSYAEPAYQIGSLFQARQMDASALHWFERTLALFWEHPRAHLQTGMIRFLRNEYAASEAAFRTGLAYAPTDPLLLVGLSATRLMQGDTWETAALLARIDALPWIAPDFQPVLAQRRRAIEQDLAAQTRMARDAAHGEPAVRLYARAGAGAAG